MRVISKKPGKQRKARANLKPHQRSKLLVAPVAEAIQAEWGIKRLPIRKDDIVRVVGGSFSEIEGKVLEIRFKKGKPLVIVEEVQDEKKDGSRYYLPLSPSKLVITKFGGKKLDPWRQKIMERKEKHWLDELAEEELVKKKGGRK